MRTTDNKISWTMTLNGAFVILWLAVQIANGFGYSTFQPPAELVIIAPAVVAIINLLLRYFRTEKPIAKS